MTWYRIAPVIAVVILAALVVGALACTGDGPELAEPTATPNLAATIDAAVAAAISTATPVPDTAATIAAAVAAAIPTVTPTSGTEDTNASAGPSMPPTPDVEATIIAAVLAATPATVQPAAWPTSVMPEAHAKALKTAREELRSLQTILDQIDHGENDSLRQQAVHSLARVNQQLDCVFGQDSRQQGGGVTEQERIRMAEGCLYQLGREGSAIIAGAELAGYAHAVFAYPDVTFDEANKISEAVLAGRNRVVRIAVIWECYTFAWGKVPYPSLPAKCR